MFTAGPATGSHCRLLQSGPPVGSASSRSCPGPRSLPCINETAAMYSIEPTIKLCLLWFALQFAVLPVRMRMRTQRYLLWPGTTQTRIADKGPPAILLHSSDRPGKRCAACTSTFGDGCQCYTKEKGRQITKDCVPPAWEGRISASRSRC
jgi:hypothetical protein